MRSGSEDRIAEPHPSIHRNCEVTSIADRPFRFELRTYRGSSIRVENTAVVTRRQVIILGHKTITILEDAELLRGLPIDQG